MTNPSIVPIPETVRGPRIERGFHTARQNLRYDADKGRLVCIPGLKADCAGIPEEVVKSYMENLWIATETGRRRRGTTLREVRNLFEEGITAAAIREELDCYPPATDASAVRGRMEELHFDVVGIREHKESKALGYVRRSDLTEGACRDHLNEFQVHDLISESTPLARVLAELHGRPRAFVLVAHEVAGIVTRADLQKPPVRLYLFGLVTLLEMHLTALIRRHYGNGDWTEHLSEGRLEGAREFQEERRQHDQDLDLVNCLQFCDKRDLVLADEALREGLEIRSKRQGERYLRAAERLRDNLAHAQALAQGTGWEERIDTVLWIEGFLERSERYFESTSSETTHQGSV